MDFVAAMVKRCPCKRFLTWRGKSYHQLNIPKRQHNNEEPCKPHMASESTLIAGTSNMRPFTCSIGPYSPHRLSVSSTSARKRLGSTTTLPNTLAEARTMIDRYYNRPSLLESNTTDGAAAAEKVRDVATLFLRLMEVAPPTPSSLQEQTAQSAPHVQDMIRMIHTIRYLIRTQPKMMTTHPQLKCVLKPLTLWTNYPAVIYQSLGCIQTLIKKHRKFSLVIRLENGLKAIAAIIILFEHPGQTRLLRIALDVLNSVLSANAHAHAALRGQIGVQLPAKLVQIAQSCDVKLKLFTSALLCIHNLAIYEWSLAIMIEKGLVALIFAVLSNKQLSSAKILTALNVLNKTVELNSGLEQVRQAGSIDRLVAEIHDRINRKSIASACFELMHTIVCRQYGLQNSAVAPYWLNECGKQIQFDVFGKVLCVNNSFVTTPNFCDQNNPNHEIQQFLRGCSGNMLEPELMTIGERTMCFRQRCDELCRTAHVTGCNAWLLELPMLNDISSKEKEEPFENVRPVVAVDHLQRLAKLLSTSNLSERKLVFDRALSPFQPFAVANIPSAVHRSRVVKYVSQLSTLGTSGLANSRGVLSSECSIDASFFTPELQFESRFESGNLQRAIRVNDTEYDFVLSSDSNHDGHTQWFLFAVRGAVPGTKYTFNIVNLEKESSAFNHGMKPVMFSQKMHEQTGENWIRATSASQICYYKNFFERTSKHPNLARSTPTRDVSSASSLASISQSSSSSFKNFSLMPNSTISSSPRFVEESRMKCSAMQGPTVAIRVMKAKMPTVGRTKSHTLPVTKRGTNASFTQKRRFVPIRTSEHFVDGSRTFFNLSFSITFPYANDTVWIGHHFPYTASSMQSDLNRICDPITTSAFMSRQPLCLTALNNVVELLTLTKFATSDAELEHVRKRPVIFLAARVHPGESNSSWIMRGLLEAACGHRPFSMNAFPEFQIDEPLQWLHNNFVIKIVPMLNVDGVVEGNYRTNLTGEDLNRQWESPSPIKHTPISATKVAIQRLSGMRKVVFFTDFHGHSKIKNAVLYGCDPMKSDESLLRECDYTVISNVTTFIPNPSVRTDSLELVPPEVAKEDPTSEDDPSSDEDSESETSSHADDAATTQAVPSVDLTVQLNADDRQFKRFPTLLSLAAPSHFNLARCQYSVRKDKAGSARVVFWRELKIPDVFTLEATFAGGSLGERQNLHFSTNDYEYLGGQFIAALIALLHQRTMECELK